LYNIKVYIINVVITLVCLSSRCLSRLRFRSICW